ncbi:MAG: CheW-like domain protein [Euryarchaeota archaeon ADurb.Bin294]|nr:MAG: CheW-like domain protein [Euryarchaeota archaeon ADurb.Bin294]
MTQRLMDTKPQSKPRTVTRQEMQVIEFNLGTDRFAIDIQNIKEIVEYTRIRPLPNSPPPHKGYH